MFDSHESWQFRNQMLVCTCTVIVISAATLSPVLRVPDYLFPFLSSFHSHPLAFRWRIQVREELPVVWEFS